MIVVQRAYRPRAMRREVFERDGEQCTFLSDDGARCPSHGHLELDHIEPRALGGPNAASNLRVRCRAHNRLYAEQVFGRTHVVSLGADSLASCARHRERARRAAAWLAVWYRNK